MSRKAGAQGRGSPRAGHAAIAATLLFLAACRTEPTGGPLVLEVEAQDAVGALQRINAAGSSCWIRASDPAFRQLSLVPELDTRAGRPRLLLLQKGRIEGLPALVIEAEGSPVTIRTYGPLAATSTGARVNADIMRWSGGRLDCRG